MNTWIQYTYRDGELTSTLERTADDMVRMLAQMHFLRQADEDITVGIGAEDELFNITCYTVHRRYKDEEVYYRFELKQ